MDPDAPPINVVAGLMSGTGATLLSGLVSVFARRTVVPDDMGARVVGIGTSEALNSDRYGYWGAMTVSCAL